MDTFNYILTLADIKERYQTSSWVRITTITMISKLGQDINLEAFRANFKPVHVRVKGTTGKGFEWTMKKTTFYNQVTIGYRDAYSQKSIKLFPNGSVQVAGCSDLFDCQRILRQVAFILSRATFPGQGVNAVVFSGFGCAHRVLADQGKLPVVPVLDGAFRWALDAVRGAV